uniref:DUF2828 domain-containing protein n=1 Tax=Mimivirus LCMiAC02 TaxID=2506609 RepID=A0A4D5XET9_9VIRU|nr:MAG: uncharacterized protein LCMiAC02_03130 [Mimivirus LCMiAC02]
MDNQSPNTQNGKSQLAREDFDNFVETKNKEEIIRYILTKFKKKRPKKPFVFYLCIVDLHSINPTTVEDIIDTLSGWGYYKDYNILLVACMMKKNEILKDLIYSKIVEQLKIDIEKWNRNEQISTLAKWIPKENKNNSFNKKLKFVDHICKILYPKLKNKFRARRKYRKTISRLTERLNVTERNICNNEYEKIDYDNVPRLCYKKNFKTFIKHDPERFGEHLRNKYKKYTLIKLVKHTFDGNLTKFEKGILNEIYDKNKAYYREIIRTKLKYDFIDMDIIVDLSKTMFDNKFINVAISICLLCLTNNKRIIVNARNPLLIDVNSTRFVDLVDQIKMEMNSFDTINLIGGIKLMSGNKLLIITNKKCDIVNRTNKEIYYWEMDNMSKLKNIKYNNVTIISGNITQLHKRSNRREVIFKKSFDKSLFARKRKIVKRFIWLLLFFIAFFLFIFWTN